MGPQEIVFYKANLIVYIFYNGFEFEPNKIHLAPNINLSVLNNKIIPINHIRY